MYLRPHKSFGQIWNMSFGYFGIQFGFALQQANVSRIFQTLGAKLEDLPLLSIAAPLTGLIVQPLIGYLSDHTWTRLGRRRPYFLVGGTLTSLALFLMPNSPSLWVSAALLWMLDASINICMEPFRAFVTDQLRPSQRTAGYAMQVFFISVASVIASLMPWLLAHMGLTNENSGGPVPLTVRYSFYIGGAALMSSMLWTVVTTHEYSHGDFGGGIVPSSSARSNIITSIAADIQRMPTAMRRLAVVQFFSWFSLFAMWIYLTPAVTQKYFGATDTRSAQYNDGANWVGVLYATSAAAAVVAPAVIHAMVHRFGPRLTHLINLWIGGIGLCSFLFISSPQWLLLSMVGIGFACASILLLPYALLSQHLPPQKVGVYMGIFNLFIVIPQLVVASVMGLILKSFFGGIPLYALVIGGCSLVVSGLAVLRVDEHDAEVSVMSEPS